jgi:general secretion pathway protein D
MHSLWTWPTVGIGTYLLTSSAAAVNAPPDLPPVVEPETPPTAIYNTCDRQPAGARFRITLDEQAELADLVRWMTSVSCQKFIWDPAVRSGKITIISPEPVTIEQAYAAFHSALATMGLSVEKAGGYYKIVESQNIPGHNLQVYGPGEQPPDGDRYVTQLLRPSEERRDEVVAALTHLKTERGAVQVAGELLILTDTAASVRRLMKVADEVDQPRDADVGLFVHPLRHADPEEVKTAVLELLGEGSARPGTTTVQTTPTRTKAKGASAAATSTTTTTTSAATATVERIVVDVRTRSLLVIARRDDHPVVRNLIERLDRPLPDTEGQIRVVRLRHADPEEVATALTSLAHGGGQKSATGSTSSVRGDVQVTADPATRSLLVDATAHDFEALRPVIEALDVERTQLYIEMYLLEVSVDHGRKFGASGHYAHKNADGDTSFVRSAPEGGPDSLLVSSDLAGLAAGLLGRSIYVDQLGKEVPSFGVMMQALASDTDVNVLSQPHLYAADNKMAKIEVGQKVPVANGVSYPGGADGNSGLQPLQSYTREPISLSVEITPHVNDEHEVTLDVKLEDEEVTEAAGNGQVTSSTRMLELEDVVARDGQPVVLGGLVKETDKITESKVPGLGSIPVLGWLFKHRNRRKQKVNLLIVLVPHILDSPDEARRIHERRLQERREFLERETGFKRHDLAKHVNYAKKAGLLATVDAEARRMQGVAVDVEHAEEMLRSTGPEEITREGVVALEPTAAW